MTVVNSYLTQCCSKVIMSGVNGNVIMSGWGKDHDPDNARRKAIGRNPTERILRNDLTVVEAAMVWGLANGSVIGLRHGS